MGLWKKIRKWFATEDNSPLPSSDDFLNDESFDPERILREMESSKDTIKENTDVQQADVKTPGHGKRNSEQDLSSLFISDEDNVDPRDVRMSSERDRRETKPQSPETETTSPTDDRGEAQEKGNRMREGFSKLADQAKTTGEKIKSGMDDFLDEVERKSKELDDIEKAESQKYSGPLKFRDQSLLDDKDDFFEKAKAFAAGQPLPSDRPEILKGPDSDAGKRKDERKVYGFEDADGDGDEIIDDAIIEEE